MNRSSEYRLKFQSSHNPLINYNKGPFETHCFVAYFTFLMFINNRSCANEPIVNRTIVRLKLCSRYPFLLTPHFRNYVRLQKKTFLRELNEVFSIDHQSGTLVPPQRLSPSLKNPTWRPCQLWWKKSVNRKSLKKLE